MSKETIMPNIMGLDLGHVQTKAIEGAWSCKFPSIAKRRSEVVASNIEDSEGYLITTREASWNVGSKGSYDFNNEKLATETAFPKFLAALGLYNSETAKSTIDLIVGSLPIDDYKIPSYMNEFTERLKGSFKFGFGKKEVYMRALQSLTLPESVGGYFDYTLTDDGEENSQCSWMASEDILVLDPGGKSTDAAIMEGGLFSQDSFTMWQGIWKVQAELRKLIFKKHHYNVSPKDIADVLQSGQVRIGKDYEPITQLSNIAIKTVFPEFRDELTLNIPDFRRFTAVLMLGGGAYVYSDYIRELTKLPVVIVENAEFANANGNRKYGVLKMKEGLI
jgi:hypothetical protein